jgi:RNA polymerase sigma-70 factor (ECF subfamily)
MRQLRSHVTPDPVQTNAWMQAVCDAHARPIYRFLLRLTLGDREAAEDLLQETLLRAWRNEADLPGEVETLRPWLFTVAFDRLLTAATVRQALLELSPEHRTVLVELYYRGASAAETAARTGIPEGTVKSRAHYALRALRNVLASAED